MLARGGQANFLVTATTSNGNTTYPITKLLGDFDTLTFDSPVVGQHTMTFRNGLQYIFQAPTYYLYGLSNVTLQATPNVTANLITIKNPWGDQLNLSYDSHGRLATITDNLGISGRTGLTFNYANGDNHITSINDWTGRTWRYAYSNGYLNNYTDPLNNVWLYFYTLDKYYNSAGTGNNLLQYVIKPQQRNGLYVKLWCQV